MGSGHSHRRVGRSTEARTARVLLATGGVGAGASARARLSAVGCCGCSCAAIAHILLFVSDHAGRSVMLSASVPWSAESSSRELAATLAGWPWCSRGVWATRAPCQGAPAAVHWRWHRARGPRRGPSPVLLERGLVALNPAYRWEVDLCWCAVGSSFLAPLAAHPLSYVVESAPRRAGPPATLRLHSVYTWAGVDTRGAHGRSGILPPGRIGKGAA
jgi:hypothetical protein